MKKKIIVFSIIFAFVILSLNTVFGAELSTVAKFTCVADEQSNKIYKINIELQDIPSALDTTQVILSGNIEYDTNLFNEIEINGENDFSANINSTDNKFILDGSYVGNEVIGEIVLNIGDIPQDTNTQINLTNISILTDLENDTEDYSNMSTTVDVQLNKNFDGASIEVLQLPKKVEYVQNSENLDVNGGIIKVTNSDNTTEEVEMTDSKVTLKGFDNSSIGTKSISVQYKGLSTTFQVSIVGNTPGITVPDEILEGDSTVSRNVIPQAGRRAVLILCVIAFILFVIISRRYIRIKRDMSGK